MEQCVKEQVETFMDSIKDITKANTIREMVRVTFPEAQGQLHAFWWFINFDWCCDPLTCLDTKITQVDLDCLKSSLIKLISTEEPKEAPLTCYVTVKSFCSSVPVQNKVKTIGTFKEIMETISQLVESCAKEMGFVVKSFRIDSFNSIGDNHITVTLYH